MSDQAGLFDLPDPVPLRPPTRSGRGRARETFARTVVADVSVHDAGALRAEASRALDHSVVIGEAADDEDDLLDPPGSAEEISTSLAAAVQWCVEPTADAGQPSASRTGHHRRQTPAVVALRQQTIDKPQVPFGAKGHHAEPGVDRSRVRWLSDRFDTPRQLGRVFGDRPP